MIGEYLLYSRNISSGDWAGDLRVGLTGETREVDGSIKVCFQEASRPKLFVEVLVGISVQVPNTTQDLRALVLWDA